MDSSLLYQLMDDASLFSDETLIKLKKMVDKWPAFAFLKILYLKNLAVLDHPGFRTELKRLSIGIPDRRKLFLLIEDKLDGQASITMSGQKERDDSFDLIDSFLSQQSEEQPRNWNDMLMSSSVSSDYIFWSMSQKPEVKNEDTPQLEHQDLIDSFLKQEEERSGRRVITEREEEPVRDDPEVKPELAVSQEDSFFTETLAQIYIKQKRYERALQIIEKLSLKYPEKNIYFADQIRFLEKLIINNKNIK